MQINASTLPQLAKMMIQERKRQKLSRSQAAAVCNVSPSFIRDAETHPERCSLGKLAMLVNGLGLTMIITDGKPQQVQGIIAQAMADGKLVHLDQEHSKPRKGYGGVTVLDPERLKP